MAGRLGIADVRQLDGLPKDILTGWQALSLVDDWSGERRMGILYQCYLMLMHIAGSHGMEFAMTPGEAKSTGKMLALQYRDFIPFAPKRKKRRVTSTELMEHHARMYG